MKFTEEKNYYKGEINVSFPVRTRVTIRTTHAFTMATVEDDGQSLNILAPNDNTYRYAQIVVDSDTPLRVLTEGDTTMVTIQLKETNEHPDSDSLCEVVHEEKLSMYDRLKAEMFQALSVYAEDKGLDTFEDDDDHTFEEDDNLINTPYEYSAMIDDMPIAPTEEPQAPAVNEPTETPIEPTTPPTEESQTAS